MKFSVAIIGNDGAGKTTIANRLIEEQAFPCRYLYMGFSTLSSNMTLPTSYLARRYKIREYKKRVAKMSDEERSRTTPSHQLHHGAPKRGSLWISIRFANRMIEALWRQLISWAYQAAGYTVLYDRHYFFDAARFVKADIQKMPWTNRLEYKVFSSFYPKPDLVIFLDAPSNVLFSRKGESTLETLDKRRENIILMAGQFENFVTVDANQSLDKVYEDVLNYILAFGKNPKT